MPSKYNTRSKTINTKYHKPCEICNCILCLRHKPPQMIYSKYDIINYVKQRLDMIGQSPKFNPIYRFEKISIWKKELAIEIFEHLTKNKKFINKYKNFAKTVQFKLIQFKNQNAFTYDEYEYYITHLFNNK